MIEQIEMQHAILAGALSSVTEFDKVVRAFDGGHVIVLEAFRALSGDGIVFKVLVEETDLRQEVLIQAWQKGDEVYVGLEAFGDPLGTRGVKEAVRAVAQWLSDQGLEIKQTWI
jgi:tRNA (guanine-N7-)-methyltransferase